MVGTNLGEMVGTKLREDVSTACLPRMAMPWASCILTQLTNAVLLHTCGTDVRERGLVDTENTWSCLVLASASFLQLRSESPYYTYYT